MHARRDALLEAAFLEFRVARQVSTGNGESYLARWYPDASFQHEIGRRGDDDKCGPGCRCNIDLQARYVRKNNVERVREFKQKDEPPKVTRLSAFNAATKSKKRQSAKARVREMERALAASGVMLGAA